jgi:hypothetical protein
VSRLGKLSQMTLKISAPILNLDSATSTYQGRNPGIGVCRASGVLIK